MKTPQQIIDALPEGNRKRACMVVFEASDEETSERFWMHMEAGEYAQAGEELIELGGKRQPHTSALLADMIWEG